MPISSYFVEALIFFIPALYLTVRTIIGGIPLFFIPKKKCEKRYLLVSVFVGSIILGLLMGFFGNDNKIIINGQVNPKAE
ncbi:MAG: hypothetical protein Q8942_13045 [Bacillota bacterium]|nr:hypothetical protein [Bacillota bacterium]